MDGENGTAEEEWREEFSLAFTTSLTTGVPPRSETWGWWRAIDRSLTIGGKP